MVGKSKFQQSSSFQSSYYWVLGSSKIRQEISKPPRREPGSALVLFWGSFPSPNLLQLVNSSNAVSRAQVLLACKVSMSPYCSLNIFLCDETRDCETCNALLSVLTFLILDEIKLSMLHRGNKTFSPLLSQAWHSQIISSFYKIQQESSSEFSDQWSFLFQPPYSSPTKECQNSLVVLLLNIAKYGITYLHYTLGQRHWDIA